MFETTRIVNEEVRKSHISRFDEELTNILKHSHNPEDIAKNFDRIFSVFQRFISYLTKNGEKKLSEELQAAFFKDIYKFINKIGKKDYFSKIFNSFPKTLIGEYNEKTIGNQISQLLGGRQRNKDLMPEGGSCHYRTLLLYKFFNELKNVGLDLEIKFFRQKKTADKIDTETNKEWSEQKHSGLVVTFQGEDYFVDFGDPYADEEESIIRKIQPYIDKYTSAYEITKSKLGENDTITLKEDVENHFKKFMDVSKKLINYYENFKHGNMKETNMVIFFDKIEDFISHLEEDPATKRMAFYLQIGEFYGKHGKLKRHHGKGKNNVENEKKTGLSHITFRFDKCYIYIEIDGKLYQFFLEDNNIPTADFPLSLIEKFTIEKDRKGFHKITKESKKLLEHILPFILKRVYLEYCDFFPKGKRRHAELVNYNGIPSNIIREEGRRQ